MDPDPRRWSGWGRVRVLLTGGRAPVTLELARLFHAAGHTVLVAESMPWPLCRFSRCLARFYRVPPPRFKPEAFVQALLDLICTERIDLLVPTCEETFYVALGLESLKTHCQVLIEPIERLNRLHNKWEFGQLARRLNLAVPASVLLTTAEEVQGLDQFEPFVLKPVYSRFASQTLIKPDPATLAGLPITSRRPWLAQQFIDGRHLCTYSLAHQGRLAAHSAYAIEFRAGASAISFETCDHPGALAWVRGLVEQLSFTGQIALDFIETPRGELFAIECNPRTTSGLHLFDDQPGISKAFCKGAGPLLTPTPGRRAMLSLPLLLYGPPQIDSLAGLRRWLALLGSSRDVLWQTNDPLPWLLQGLPVLNLLFWSYRHKLNLLCASTYDIEWNGP